MMKEKLHEQLSALVDDELADTEESLLIRRLAEDQALCDSLMRYQLISDAMRNHLPQHVDPGFRRRVQMALENESAAGPGIPGAARARLLLKPLAGLAVAASVAVVAVVSFQDARQGQPAAPVIASMPADNAYIRANDGPQLASKPRDSRRLGVYLANHNEYAINRGMRGILPYVHIVGHNQGSEKK